MLGPRVVAAIGVAAPAGVIPEVVGLTSPARWEAQASRPRAPCRRPPCSRAHPGPLANRGGVGRTSRFWARRNGSPVKATMGELVVPVDRWAPV